MTREEARKKAEVMIAYADGKKVEYKDHDDKIWCDVLETPVFNWNRTDYRIKKEPTYRPFKDKDECWAEMQKHQPFGWVLDGSLPKTLNCIARNGAQLNDVYYIFEELFAIVTFADGTPFGIKEE